MSLIHKKILAVMADVSAIGKTNQAEGFRFRGADDIYNALNPLFQKHGIFCTSTVLAQQGNDKGKTILEAKFDFFAEDGSYVSSTTRGESVNKDDKGSTIAQTIAHRIALTQMFLLPTDNHLPWMTPHQITKARERISNGDFQLYFKLEETYRMKKEDKDELRKLIKK